MKVWMNSMSKFHSIQNKMSQWIRILKSTGVPIKMNKTYLLTMAISTVIGKMVWLHFLKALIWRVRELSITQHHYMVLTKLDMIKRMKSLCHMLLRHKMSKTTWICKTKTSIVMMKARISLSMIPMMPTPKMSPAWMVKAMNNLIAFLVIIGILNRKQLQPWTIKVHPTIMELRVSTTCLSGDKTEQHIIHENHNIDYHSISHFYKIDLTGTL